MSIIVIRLILRLWHEHTLVMWQLASNERGRNGWAGRDGGDDGRCGYNSGGRNVCTVLVSTWTRWFIWGWKDYDLGTAQEKGKFTKYLQLQRHFVILKKNSYVFCCSASIKGCMLNSSILGCSDSNTTLECYTNSNKHNFKNIWKSCIFQFPKSMRTKNNNNNIFYL